MAHVRGRRLDEYLKQQELRPADVMIGYVVYALQVRNLVHLHITQRL
jgi:hypothetical protein